MKQFVLEGSVCFAHVPPGFYVRLERYDMYPNGTVRWALTIAPEAQNVDDITEAGQ